MNDTRNAITRTVGAAPGVPAAEGTQARPGPRPAGHRGASARTTERRADASSPTREDLMRAGRKLFSERGFDGTSVRALTALAGANLGAVTYHFGSKAALYEAVLKEALLPLADRLGRVASAPGTALDRMVAVVGAYFDHLAEHPELPRLLLQEVAAGKEPPAIVTEVVGRMRARLVELHRQGVEEGTIRPGNPTLTALSVVSQPVYLTLSAPLVHAVAGLDIFDPETRATAVKHVTTFVRAGLEARAPTPALPGPEPGAAPDAVRAPQASAPRDPDTEIDR